MKRQDHPMGLQILPQFHGRLQERIALIEERGPTAADALTFLRWRERLDPLGVDGLDDADQLVGKAYNLLRAAEPDVKGAVQKLERAIKKVKPRKLGGRPHA